MVEIEKQIDNVNYNVQIFQMNKCSACDTSLQLPAIHFLCKHSYHAHCLESYSEKADSCPACTRDNLQRTCYDQLKDFSSRGAYAQFLSEVNEAPDCMPLISSYIACGLFDSQKKMKGTESEHERKSIHADTNLKTHATGTSSEDQSPAETASASTPTSNPYSLPRSRTTRRPLPRQSTNPFDVEEVPKNPFEDDL
ncbi:unnamed protein product [Gongylonema pulchrum]|uniref:RING-type domain-containing protein n=1 Tax=Gongylonema pulchrum TaxID=637853 RepID=A0A183ESL6_9BILA|nr:unnamed protein product [Gongylonema pulchrum]